MHDSPADNDKRGGSVRSTLAKKVLMPLVATAASAGASYFAKKAPQFLEDKVMPRLRDVATGAGDAAQGLPDRAKSAASSAGEAAQDLPGRVKATRDSPTANGGGGRTRARQALSSSERERQRSERAKHRAARRKTSTS
jgi:hypothetical protein